MAKLLSQAKDLLSKLAPQIDTLTGSWLPYSMSRSLRSGHRLPHTGPNRRAGLQGFCPQRKPVWTGTSHPPERPWENWPSFLTGAPWFPAGTQFWGHQHWLCCVRQPPAVHPRAPSASGQAGQNRRPAEPREAQAAVAPGPLRTVVQTLSSWQGTWSAAASLRLP